MCGFVQEFTTIWRQHQRATRQPLMPVNQEWEILVVYLSALTKHPLRPCVLAKHKLQVEDLKETSSVQQEVSKRMLATRGLRHTRARSLSILNPHACTSTIPTNKRSVFQRENNLLGERRFAPTSKTACLPPTAAMMMAPTLENDAKTRDYDTHCPRLRNGPSWTPF